MTIYQGVTIGLKSIHIPEYPSIDDNVVIYAGAKIFGSVKIGKQSVVGANAVVTKDVPDNMIAMGVPAKITGENIESCS